MSILQVHKVRIGSSIESFPPKIAGKDVQAFWKLLPGFDGSKLTFSPNGEVKEERRFYSPSILLIQRDLQNKMRGGCLF